MRHRCNNPKNKDFRYYGGRGIRVCSAWDSFAGFWSDMGKSYQEGLTIDRKDTEGNYEPDNCRWATRLVQARNRRKKVDMTSEHIGVSWRQASGSWVAQITIKGRVRHLGLFSSEEQAALARQVAEKKFW